MRVIAGSLKGRKLKTPKTNIRPLSDQAKEALFNILMNRIQDSIFLDVFAGSGSVGIEALSRGAKAAFFIEKDRKHVSIIKDNLSEFGLYDRAEVYSLEAVRALKILNSKGAKFDIIFLGAPYNSPVLIDTLKLLGECDLLKPEGVIIAEHRFKQKVDSRFGGIIRFREEKYGDTMLGFFQLKIKN